MLNLLCIYGNNASLKFIEVKWYYVKNIHNILNEFLEGYFNFVQNRLHTGE
jgi:hypothetical protein